MKREIQNISARQILDSRGNPTIEAEVQLVDGSIGTASVPSGASTGSYEAVELRDNIESCYNGKSVTLAVNHVNKTIASNLIGEDAGNQRGIDNIMIELDGTSNKSKLGANAILGVSLACARAVAKSYDIPLFKYLGGLDASILPTPMMNIINGGAHTNNNLDFQEFMITPVGFETFSDGLKAGVEIFHKLKSILKDKGFSTNVGDEGGFAPNLSNTEQAIELIIESIEKSGYNTNSVKICLDVAASEFYETKQSVYNLRNENKSFSTEEMIDYLEKLTEEYPIISIEDGLAENDEQGWIKLTERIGDKCQLVGDDLFVTNVEKLSEGIENKVANSILIKPNQIGTLSEALDAILLAQKNNYSTIMSHRSGETEDSFISDLAVGVNAGLIKTGSLSRTDRVCKYNRLLKIEELLGENAKYMGIQAFNCLKK